MSRGSVAIGAASGSVASVLLRALLDLAYPSESRQPSFIQPGLDCICDSGVTEFFQGLDLDWRSVAIGVFIGVSLGPVYDLSSWFVGRGFSSCGDGYLGSSLQGSFNAKGNL